MLRITCTSKPHSVTLKLEGQLAAEGVGELKKVWRSPQVMKVGKLIVDLDDVTRIDGAGKRLLAAMHRHGARFIAEGVFMQHIVKQITSATSQGGGKSGSRRGHRL